MAAAGGPIPPEALIPGQMYQIVNPAREKAPAIRYRQNFEKLKDGFAFFAEGGGVNPNLHQFYADGDRSIEHILDYNSPAGRRTFNNLVYGAAAAAPAAPIAICHKCHRTLYSVRQQSDGSVTCPLCEAEGEITDVSANIEAFKQLGGRKTRSRKSKRSKKSRRNRH